MKQSKTNLFHRTGLLFAGLLFLTPGAFAQRSEYQPGMTLSLGLDGSRILIQLEGDQAGTATVEGQPLDGSQIEKRGGLPGSLIMTIKDVDGVAVFRVDVNDGRASVRRLPRSDRAAIGIEMGPLSRGLADHLELDPREVIYVTSVVEDRAAAKAGLRDHDVIVEIDGRSPAGERVLQEVLGEKKPGDRMSVKVLRRGQESEIVIRCDRARASENFGGLPGSSWFAASDLGDLFEPNVTYFNEGASDFTAALKSLEGLQGFGETSEYSKAFEAARDALKKVDGSNVRSFGGNVIYSDGSAFNLTSRPKVAEAIKAALESVEKLNEGLPGSANDAYREAIKAAQEALQKLDKKDTADFFRSYSLQDSGDGVRTLFTSPGKTIDLGAATPLIATKPDGKGMVMLDTAGDGVQKRLDELQKRFDRLESLLQQLNKKDGKIR